MLVGSQISLKGIDILVFASYHKGGIDLEVLASVIKATARGRIPFCSTATSTISQRRLESTSGWRATTQS